MAVLESKVLIFSVKLVHQKLRHHQQPSGILPTQGCLERGFMWVQVALFSCQTYFCPLPGSRSFLGCWFVFGHCMVEHKQFLFLCALYPHEPLVVGNGCKSYWQQFLLSHQDDTLVDSLFLWLFPHLMTQFHIFLKYRY